MKRSMYFATWSVLLFACGSADSGGGAAAGGTDPLTATSEAGGGSAGTSANSTSSSTSGTADSTTAGGTTAGSGGSAGTGGGSSLPGGAMPSTPGGRPGTDTTTTPVGDATFTEVWALLEARCAGAACHVGAAIPGGGLALTDAAAAYDALVGAASLTCSGQLLVAPGDAAASVLLMSLSGGSSCAPMMPRNGTAFGASELALVAAWIDAGAAND
ncbi:MAG: hypothetical protein OEZ06_03230 [Myxococcales bacterium]|nr:hypothetical protein [Myxococcales bacterium]